MDQNRMDIESLLYRTGKLDAKYAELKHLVSGTGEDYTHLLKTKTGKYSSRSLNRMIDDLTDCLAEYRSYLAAVRKSHQAKMEKTVLSDDDNEFYKAYFYLMLGLATYEHTGHYTRNEKPGTWDALLERVSEPVEYSSPAELDSDLILYDLQGLPPLRVPSGLFYDICDSYRTVSGEDFSSLLSEKEIRAAKKLMTKEELYYAGNPEKKQQEDIGDLAEMTIDPDFAEELSVFIEEAIKEDDHLTVDNSSSENDWAIFFADKKRFQDSCLTVKSGILRRIKKSYAFRKEIEMAVKLYLWNNKISKIADDSFFTVYIYLERAKKAAENSISENLR